MGHQLLLQDQVALVDVLHVAAVDAQDAIVVAVGGVEARVDVLQQLVVEPHLAGVPGGLGWARGASSRPARRPTRPRGADSATSQEALTAAVSGAVRGTSVSAAGSGGGLSGVRVTTGGSDGPGVPSSRARSRTASRMRRNSSASCALSSLAAMAAL